jgi:hypothetical protein
MQELIIWVLDFSMLVASRKVRVGIQIYTKNSNPEKTIVI